MKVILTHPTGNRNVRAVMQSLSEANMLAKFNTTIATDLDAAWLKCLPSGVRKECLRRNFQVAPDKINSYPFLEIMRFISLRLGLKNLTQYEHSWASVDAVYHHLDRSTASSLANIVRKDSVTAVYAYEDGALETFKQAKKLGLKCIYDLPIAYWETVRKLLDNEAKRLPEWAGTLGGGINDSEAKLRRKTEELELADVVVGPGNFVMDSLPDWAGQKQLIMSPFGSPAVQYPKITTAKNDNHRPLRVLFAGSMGQRKGLGDLFAAIRLLNSKDIELVVMGSLLSPMSFYRSQLENFTYEPGRAHSEVLELMRSCDVFCLPSIVEGRALVMQEAMSQGLPLIITSNTGGADLIMEGDTGFLVPIDSPEAIAEKLNWFLDNRNEIPRMGLAAQQHASRYTWENYGAAIINAIAPLSLADVC